MILHRRMVAAAAAGVLIFGCGFAVNPAGRLDVPVIVTAAPVYDALAALRGGERFPKGAQLLLLRSGEAKPLLSGFAASADAAVSFDGNRMLFAGRRTANDPWAIWELTLADGSLRRVMSAATDLIRPLYLPDDALVYARRTDHGFQVEAAGMDGAQSLPLTYLRSSAVPADVLADGRILFEAGFPLGVGVEHGAKPEMYLVYPDGSGVESYRCDHGAARWGGRQMASGDLVFTHGASLARFTSPLATEARIAAPHAEYAGGIAEIPSGAWLVSERPGATGHYALSSWAPGSAALHPLLSRAGENLVEPVVVVPRTPPRAHPGALHKWEYANLLALDARQSRSGDLKVLPARVQLETTDDTGHHIVLGTAQVAADGSFFVQAPGDRPIRFALLDAKGATIREEHGWFWIRKGEQRICVGCHVGPERASENHVPAVLLRATIPVDLTGQHGQTLPGGR
jgi:hypothetical protein